MIDVKKVEDFEKLTTSLNGIKTAIENIPTPLGVEVTGAASGTIATFNDGSANPLKSLVVDINPVQAGSGTPAPDNVRPISGWSSVEVTVADDTTDPTTEETYEITLGQTVYGGKLNVTTGELTVDRAMVDLSSVSFTYDSSNKRWNRQFSDMKNYSTRSVDLMFEQYESTITAYTGDTGTAFALGNTIYIYDADQTLTISGKCVYELATPTTATLTPTEVDSLLGNNSIWADTGDSNVVYIRDMNIAFNILWNAIMT